MHYFILFLVLFMLTLVPADLIGQASVPTEENATTTVETLLALTASSTNFYQQSRLLLFLFLILLSLFSLSLIRAWISQREAEAADLLKRNLQKDLTSKTLKALQEKLAEKDKQLAVLTLALEEKDNMLKQLKGQLNEWYALADGKVKGKIHAFRYAIDRNLHHQQDWLPFQKRLSEVHPGFISRLQKRFPGLSVKDLRLCSYLRMNLSTQEIASLTHIHQSSVQKARYRLKKKMALPAWQDLNEFIIAL